jgi:hypothetical protein
MSGKQDRIYALKKKVKDLTGKTSICRGLAKTSSPHFRDQRFPALNSENE